MVSCGDGTLDKFVILSTYNVLFQSRLSARFKITSQTSLIFRNFGVYILYLCFSYELIFP